MGSLPRNLSYPTFPKHGHPRIVTTLGLLSIPILIISVCVLALFSGSSFSGSTALRLNENSQPSIATVGTSIQSSRERGFQAGLDYGLRVKGSNTGKNPDQQRTKKLAAQMSAKEHEDENWQQGWIEGYKKALASVAQSIGESRLVRDQAKSRDKAPETPLERPRVPSNGYIRGPRGGCYYISGSGRKVYVDRGLCN